MKNQSQMIQKELEQILGLPLSIARRCADMRVLHFGKITEDQDGSFGEYSLHIQCPWRLENVDGIITGRMDLYEPMSEVLDDDCEWDDEKENLQDKKMLELLEGYDSRTKSPVNRTQFFIVESIESNNHGSVTIRFSGGYSLILFPAGSAGEDWRFFKHHQLEPHFVVEGGKILDD